ncbi:MAG: RluA family pseudouridine synthase [Malacoplasma sp.]|nr:RluA family pseudouridine synthase [Malacoplasma sp.]
MTTILIKKEDSKKILRDFLSEKFPQLSSSKINKSIKNGDIKVNKKKSNWNYELKENDQIHLFLKIKQNKNMIFLKANKNIKIIYEDENIIVVDKPRGIICQPDKNEKINTLNNQIKKYLYDKKDKAYESTNLCHRLDKYTSGLCIGAKNQKTLKELNTLWNTKAISKFYLALCYGKFKEKKKMLVNYVYFNETSQKMEIDRKNIYNKKMETKYSVIRQNKNYALLEIEILTGKKHQIRVHMASIGNPVLGDTKYNKINNFSYQFPCLISYKLKFNFPKNHFLNYLNEKNITTNIKNFK